MKCPRCQHENPPQAKFCLECGARFAVACAQCGTATALYREMDMPYWLEQAEAELRRP